MVSGDRLPKLILFFLLGVFYFDKLRKLLAFLFSEIVAFLFSEIVAFELNITYKMEGLTGFVGLVGFVILALAYF